MAQQQRRETPRAGRRRRGPLTIIDAETHVAAQLLAGDVADVAQRNVRRQLQPLHPLGVAARLLRGVDLHIRRHGARYHYGVWLGRQGNAGPPEARQWGRLQGRARARQRGTLDARCNTSAFFMTYAIDDRRPRALE